MFPVLLCSIRENHVSCQLSRSSPRSLISPLHFVPSTYTRFYFNPNNPQFFLFHQLGWCFRQLRSTMWSIHYLFFCTPCALWICARADVQQFILCRQRSGASLQVYQPSSGSIDSPQSVQHKLESSWPAASQTITLTRDIWPDNDRAEVFVHGFLCKILNRIILHNDTTSLSVFSYHCANFVLFPNKILSLAGQGQVSISVYFETPECIFTKAKVYRLFVFAKCLAHFGEKNDRQVCAKQTVCPSAKGCLGKNVLGIDGSDGKQLYVRMDLKHYILLIFILLRSRAACRKGFVMFQLLDLPLAIHLLLFR